MDVKDIIKSKRLEKELTMKELADLVGVSEATVSRWESGEIANMRRSGIVALSKALSIQPSLLIDGTESEIENIYPITTKTFPLLGSVSCGEPIYADENQETYIEAGTNINADFCLKAQGDSMVGARIQDGDIVFIRQQDFVDNGRIAAVIVGDEATLKRIEYYRERNTLLLKSENPDYPTQIYTNSELDQVKILGQAVAFQSDVK